jgi:hypothetical protein
MYLIFLAFLYAIQRVSLDTLIFWSKYMMQLGDTSLRLRELKQMIIISPQNHKRMRIHWSDN